MTIFQALCNVVQLIMVHQGAPASLDLECDTVDGQMGCNYTYTL